MHDAAMSRIELRRAIEAEMDKQTYDGPSEAPRMITRFWPTHGRELGRQGPRRHSNGMDRRSRLRLHHGMVRVKHCGRVRRRHSLLPAIQIGDLIEVDARLLRTDARSMQVVVHVRSGDPRSGRNALENAIHATITYVGVDLDGVPLPARPFVPRTTEDIRLAEHA